MLKTRCINKLVSNDKRNSINAFILDSWPWAKASLQESIDYSWNIWNQVGIRKKNIIFESPKSCMLILDVLWRSEVEKYIDVSLVIISDVLVLSHYSGFLDALLLLTIAILLIWLLGTLS